MINNKKMSLSSLCVKEHQENRTTKPHQLPIYATSSFEFESMEDGIDIFTGKKSGHVYSRYGNPTVDTVSQKLADIEAFNTGLQAYGYLTSSGMSAISTVVLSMLKTGDNILTQSDLYGGTTEMFLKVISQSGIKTIFTDLAIIDEVEYILQTNRNIKLLYFETPANPTMKCIDIHHMARLAKKYGIITCVDNTFCTPIIQQPLAMGIDFVIHSTTKYLNGHGNSIAGVIIGHDEKYKKQIWTTLKLLGTTCNAWDAWLINNGIKTLPLRMQKHSENAMEVAMYLSKHPNVRTVNYNGLPDHPWHEVASKQMKSYGGMLSFEAVGTLKQVLTMINKLHFCTMAPTLGDVDTLVLHPATSSHLNVEKTQREANGISDGLVRLSIGIEDVHDIIADLQNALK
ncbi:MAG: aminotransferase class I/II-fold pyridoxal phosphate-dependent enzyme [Saprospiraceae bacterium]|jgi:methionine-gamma-lyase|nr:aminotransferase class I/II-fold pyridoxal phosphate-dependent enzyme [Saprospiraceae bacterium]